MKTKKESELKKIVSLLLSCIFIKKITIKLIVFDCIVKIAYFRMFSEYIV